VEQHLREFDLERTEVIGGEVRAARRGQNSHARR